MNFNKLISNLPFNPSLVGQVSFYAKRVHKEASLRRFGFGLIAIAMLLQMFAIISPPERSMAASPDHILDGINTSKDILAAWDRKGSDIAAVYGKFGVTRADIAGLPMYANTTLRSNAGPDYWTIGRNSLSNYSTIKTTYKDAEIALKAGSSIIYMRQLRAWDIKNPYNTYAAFSGHLKNGTQFWILKDCGNYTQVGKYTPAKPGLQIRKTVSGSATVKPGETASFRIEYRNSVADSLAENVVIHDKLDLSHYTIVSPSGLNLKADELSYNVGNLGYTANYKLLDITVRLKDPYPTGSTQTCNVASMGASNAPTVTSTPSACINVIIPCPYNSALPIGDAKCKPPVPPVTPCKYDANLSAKDPNCVEPKLICSLLDTDLDTTTRTATFRTDVSSTNQKATKIVSYAYDFGDGKKATQNNTAFTDTIKHVYAAGTFNASVVVSYTITGDTGATKRTITCADTINFEADKPLGESKIVKNITQNISGDKANGSTVHGGDVLEYTLTTSNTQDYARKNITISDYVGDILDYGDIDMSYLASQGGTFDANTKKVVWANVTLAAKTDSHNSFKVTIKKPVPATNSPSSVSGTFDCKISNKYGNEIDMKVDCPVVKGIESLPNTGPGTSALFGFVVTIVVGYFFARSRIMARELDLIKDEYAPSGGF